LYWNKINIYDAQSGVLHTTIRDEIQARTVALSSDGTRLAVGGAFGATIYDTHSGAALTIIKDVIRVRSVALSAHGIRLVVGGTYGAAIYDAQSGVRLTTMKDVSEVNSVAISTDDTRLAVGHYDGADIYEFQSGKVLTTIKDVGTARSVALFTDGTRLAVCDAFGKSTIYDLKTNLPLFTVASAFGNDCFVKYSTDGSIEKLGKDAWKCFCWRIPPEKPGESPKLLPLEAFYPRK
jgi:WD40 repeat protein